MARSRAVTLVASVYSLYAFVVTAGAIYCFWLARFMIRTNQPNAAGVATALRIGAALFAVVAAIYSVAAAGLWRSARWGWWLGLLTNIAAVVAILSDTFSGDRDPDNWAALLI